MALVRFLMISILIMSGSIRAQNCEGVAMKDVLGLAANALPVQGSQMASANAATAADETLTDALTNIALAGASQAINIRDFLPLLSIAGLSGDLQGESGNEVDNQLGLDLNLPLFGSAKDGRELKISASLTRQPTAFEPLVNAAAEDTRDSFRSTLEDGLDLTDEVTYSLTYNVTNNTLGRYRGLVGYVFDDVLNLPDHAEYDTATRTYMGFLQRLVPSYGPLTPVMSVQFKSKDDQPMGEGAEQERLRHAFCNAFVRFGALSQALDESQNRALHESGIDRIAKLAGNQPQLQFSLGMKARDEKVGPDETTLMVTFEWGYKANLNKLSDAVNKELSGCGDVEVSCRLRAFSNYLDANEAAIDASERLSFSLQYSDVDDYRFSSNDLGMDFSKVGAEKIALQIGYGRNLSDRALGGGRLDVSVKYEDADDDEALNDRVVGVATLTKKFGDITVPLSLVYSNEPEFVAMESNNNLSAHFGLKYDFE